MENKRGTVPGYGRGRAVWRNNIDNTVNRPVGNHGPREWYQRYGYSVCGRGQQAFSTVFNGGMNVSRFVTPGTEMSNSSIGNNVRRGKLSWADIRQQSQLSNFEMRTLDANNFQLDKSHVFPNRAGHVDGPWGGRGRGILEKASRKEESSSPSSQNNVWGGQGRGRILGVPETSYERTNFRSENSLVMGHNKSHSGHFRGGLINNQNKFATNKREPMSIPLPFLFQKLDLNSTCKKQVQNKPKKKQQRKNWRKGRKERSLGESGSGESAKNVEESSSQSSISFEGKRNDTETDTKKGGQKTDLSNVLPNKKQLVIINSLEESDVEIKNKQETPNESHNPSDGVNKNIINRQKDTVSNTQQKICITANGKL